MTFQQASTQCDTMNRFDQVHGTPAIIARPSIEIDQGGTELLSKPKLEGLVKEIDPETELDPVVEEVHTRPSPSLIPLGLMLRTAVDLGVRGRVHR
jgi:transcription initiation factor TFIID subunit TAF12